jgi:AraC family transcriptional regulator of adaptative response/methylated-DNA-[protein]-cysteine methyltransferase
MNKQDNYTLIARTLKWVASHRNEQPDLDQLAREMGLSPHHLQRTFQDWAGVSPKQFLKSLTRQEARERLISGNTVLATALDSGLSGPGRLHDLMVSTEALSPGEVRTLGKGVEIRYGAARTPFGEAVLAWTERGINFLGFTEDIGYNNVVNSLKNKWVYADFIDDQGGAREQLKGIFSDAGEKPIRLWLRGSPFQLKVWEALMAIPEGAHATYGQIAARIGQPSASRAVGSAIGNNPVAWIIPCHRVIRQLGELGGYRWGEITKQAMIGYEAGSRLSEAS